MFYMKIYKNVKEKIFKYAKNWLKRCLVRKCKDKCVKNNIKIMEVEIQKYTSDINVDIISIFLKWNIKIRKKKSKYQKFFFFPQRYKYFDDQMKSENNAEWINNCKVI